MQNAGGMRLAGQALQAAAGKQAGAYSSREGIAAAESCLGAVLSLLPLVVTQQRHPLLMVLTTQNRENAECGRNAARQAGAGAGQARQAQAAAAESLPRCHMLHCSQPSLRPQLATLKIECNILQLCN